MPRSLRLEFSGAYYHVMARGNRRHAIFYDDDDRRFFLSELAEARGMTGWQFYCWVLMGSQTAARDAAVPSRCLGSTAAGWVIVSRFAHWYHFSASKKVKVNP